MKSIWTSSGTSTICARSRRRILTWAFWVSVRMSGMELRRSSMAPVSGLQTSSLSSCSRMAWASPRSVTAFAGSMDGP